MKRVIVCVFVTLLMAASLGAQSVSLDHVSGLIGPGQVTIDRPIIFYLRMANVGVGSSATELTNGFVLSSPDGAQWNPITPGYITAFDTLFDPWMGIFHVTGHGMQADTIGFAFRSVTASGMPDGYDDVSLILMTEIPTASSIGATICIDSAFYPPSGAWIWSYDGLFQAIPSWDGPHCFAIVDAPVCECPYPGDVDGSASLDISDLTYMVDYFFGGGPAPLDDDDCPVPNRGDMNCDYSVDISDLTYYVDYMFGGGPAPCDACFAGTVLPDGDPLPEDSLLFLMENYYNAIWDTGTTVFDYTNRGDADIWFDTSNYVIPYGTRTEVESWHSNDDAHIYGPPSVPTGSIGQGGADHPSPLIKWDADRAKACSTLIVHMSGCQENGVAIACSEMRIECNQVISCCGHEFYEFSSETPYISNRISESYHNPPHIDTANAVFWCSYPNTTYYNGCDVKSWRKWVKEEIEYSEEYIYRFEGSYALQWMHDVYWMCVDSSMIREIWLSVSIEERIYVNDVLVDEYTCHGSLDYRFK